MVGSTWFHVVAAFLVFGMLLTFVAKPYWVPSGSMENTLQPGDRILVNRLAYVGSQPATGEPFDEPYVYNDFAFQPGTLDCGDLRATCRARSSRG
ncbi:S26 family signal peptidase [Microbacterium sp. E-13]|uniref:S26 family signal peptidase n=1 Tax=Microbacterium sp. E-13 TaxID=3404048 RepID=UPI003CEA9881